MKNIFFSSKIQCSKQLIDVVYRACNWIFNLIWYLILRISGSRGKLKALVKLENRKNHSEVHKHFKNHNSTDLFSRSGNLDLDEKFE